MFRIHRLFIKTALVFLLLGVGLGGFLLVDRALALGYWFPAARTMHLHLVLVGFMAMMVMGVAHWMFPRQPGTRKADIDRDWAVWANYLLITVGLSLRMVAEPWAGRSWGRWALLASAGLQLAGFLVFVVTIWGRVRPPSSFAR